MERVGDGKSDFPPFPGLGPGRQLSAVAVVTATSGSPFRTEECLLCLSSLLVPQSTPGVDYRFPGSGRLCLGFPA